MKSLAAVVLGAAMVCGAAPTAAAQDVVWFAGAALHRDINEQMFPGVAGGVLLDVANSWASVGGQACLLTSGGYVSGRAGPMAQVNVIRLPSIRVSALGGYAAGEEGGAMVGAAIEFRLGPVRLRASVEDYLARVGAFDCAFFGYSQDYCEASLHGGRAYTAHRPTVQVGFVWR